MITPVKAEAPPPLPSTLIFEDDFENYSVGSFPSAGGWSLRFDGSGNNKIVNTFSVSPNKSFQLQGGPWGGYCTCARVRIDDKCQLVYFQAYIRLKGPITEHSGGAVSFAHWESNPDMPAGRALINLRGDGIIYTGGGGAGGRQFALQPYAADTWYKAEILLNKATDVYWIWIDDQYMGEFRTYFSSIDVDCFHLGAGKDRSIVYFDDVKIFGEIPNNPTARITASTFFPYINETVIFDASDSLPGWNGTHTMPIVSYDWNFGDSSTGTGVTATHTYTMEGTYAVTLNVTDIQGLWHITSKTVTASPEPPLPPFLVDMYDDFNDNSINTTFWDKYEQGCGLVYERNERLEISGFGGGTAGLVTKEAHDLTTVDIQVDTHNTGRLSQSLIISPEKYTNESISLCNETYRVSKINRDDSLEIARVINNVRDVLYCGPWTSAAGTVRIFISDGTIRFYEDEFLRYREPYQLSTYNCYIYINSYAPSVGQWDYFDNFYLYGVPRAPGGPIAKFGYSPSSPKVNDAVTFDASDSLPGWNGTHCMPIVSYVWDFGDSSTGTGLTTTHVYTEEGSYTVILNVTDSQGLWDTASKTVNVSPLPPPHGPTAHFTFYPSTPLVNGEVSFDASDSLPGFNGDTTVPIANYTWDFGDGTSPVTTTSPTVTHIYTTEGTYTVSLTVKCKNDPVLIAEGLTSDTTSQTVNVAAYAKVHLVDQADWTRWNLTNVYSPGDSFTLDVIIENVTDLYGWDIGAVWDPNILTCTGFTEGTFLTSSGYPTLGIDGTIDNVAGKIDPMYGRALKRAPKGQNGSSTDPGKGALASMNFILDPTLVYYDKTWINLTITLWDSRMKPITMTVNHAFWLYPPPHGPIAHFTYSPNDAFINVITTFDASASSPGWSGTVTVPIAEYTWDFGDGTHVTTTNPAVTHTYTAVGNYTVTLTVTDDKGNWNTITQTATVNLAEFSLVALYTLHLDLNYWSSEGAKLTAAFYTYEGVYQGNTTVWTGETPTWVELSTDIVHPQGEPIEIVKIVLTDDSGNVLHTAKSYAIRRSDLMGTLGELDQLWTVPGADRTAIMKEYVTIDGQWSYAPP